MQGRRRERWSNREWELFGLLDQRGLVIDAWPNGRLLRDCRVCGSGFMPTRDGGRGPFPIECGDECRRVYAAWNVEQWRQGVKETAHECAWCFGLMRSISESRCSQFRYCSRRCQLAASNHRTSNEMMDRCEVPRCQDCGLVGCVSRKKRKANRSSTKRPRGRCRDCHRRWVREYELNRPIKPVRDRNRLRARVIAAGDRMTTAEIIDRFGNICYLCGIEIDVMIDNHRDPMYLNIDHIVPIARGGRHTWDNVAPTHKRCNESKGAKLVAPPVGWNGTWIR